MNVLLSIIRETLCETHIESGRTDEYESTCKALENNISKKIVDHKIDYYTELEKLVTNGE